MATISTSLVGCQDSEISILNYHETKWTSIFDFSMDISFTSLLFTTTELLFEEIWIIHGINLNLSAICLSSFFCFIYLMVHLL